MRNAALQKLPLVEYLEWDNELAFFLTRKVDMAKLATTEWFADLEVIDGPLSAIKCLMDTSGSYRNFSQHWRPVNVVWSWGSLTKVTKCELANIGINCTDKKLTLEMLAKRPVWLTVTWAGAVTFDSSSSTSFAIMSPLLRFIGLCCIIVAVS